MLVEKLTDISLRLSNSSSLGENINPQKSIIIVMNAKRALMIEIRLEY